MSVPKREPEYREGPEAARKAESILRRVLAVPKQELDRREAEYQTRRKSEPAIRRNPASR